MTGRIFTFSYRESEANIFTDHVLTGKILALDDTCRPSISFKQQGVSESMAPELYRYMMERCAMEFNRYRKLPEKLRSRFRTVVVKSSVEVNGCIYDTNFIF